jgi:hypothetical protein
MRRVELLLLLILAAAPASAQSIPAVKAKALDNSEVTLPGSASRQALILVVGFSHKSGEPCNAWDKKISSDFHSDARVGYFILPILQSAPSLVRPMILHGMRKDLPQQELPHYLPIYSKEDDWKKLVSITELDQPYLIVAGGGGHVVWQGRGAYSEESYGEMKKAVMNLLSN